MKLRHCFAAVFTTCIFFSFADARERLSFNSDWKFFLGEADHLAQMVGFDDEEWRVLNVPHDWSIEQPFSKDNPPQNAWLPGGIGWYRKQFELSAEDASQYVELQFDGVYKHAKVWVNGEFVGVQYDGYTSFYFDISPYVKEGTNLIAVRADNSLQPNCRWYTGSGIYRNVWLTVKEPLHVENWGTYITTPKVSNSEAQVNVVTTITNRMESYSAFTLYTEIIDSAGEIVAKGTSAETLIGAGQSVDVEQSFDVFHPKLWSIDSPQLYTAVSKVMVAGEVTDTYESRFGIREIIFDAEKGFFLNGENMKMKGVNLHAEASTFGSAVPAEVWERRLRGLKAAGCNAIRTAHNAMGPEFMALCDELGFLVMDEFVDKWDHPQFADPYFGLEWRKNFRETIRRDRNHPSVVIWSVGNENYPAGSQKQTEGLELYCDFVRSIDPTRPVVSGMERGLDMDPTQKVDDILESTQHMDLIGMNYGDQWVKRIGHRNPGKAFISTESYTYYGSTETERWAHVERSPWFDVVENDHNVGLFLWVGIEYLGEIPAEGPLSWPEIFCWPGHFLDSAGFRTPMFYQYQALWTDEPMVYIGVYDRDTYFSKDWGAPVIMGNWNHPDGTELDLVTYTNCEFLDLYLNGRKIGRQKLADFSNWVMNWYSVAYEPGTLRAVGIRNGEEVCSFEIRTAGDPEQIELKADYESVSSGDIIHVEVQLLDANGIPVVHTDRELDFKVEGGEVIALDNGALTALDEMQARTRRSSFGGKCLAVIRVIEEQVNLTVDSKGLKAGTITLP
ncbi:sugar-binding domain-containing protein [Rubellicoccus peritrichatus]|uniref:Glycoside hydrolase family 2 TIM barrel-domain containing protein n=1 Tax=Rubellicoccus peritrichatus TaxID=3080537 RepID=A0AAQ3LB07_9BACT|nr:sugar-binding domain-containing protein [Puniceicoccus sp. CR14]WOO40615.1 glycoside hydrolase family 2 TIM barrel-domain containing protein [Puniceicoccus sp. CR14]